MFGRTIFSVMSDGVGARYGTLWADSNRFMRWRTVHGETIRPDNDAMTLETLTEGLLNRRTLLDMLRRFLTGRLMCAAEFKNAPLVVLTDRNDLKKLLNGEINAKTRSNVVQNEKLSVRLSDAIARCHNQSIDTTQVIQELLAIASDLKLEPDGNLSEAERSYYDALSQNESAVEVMGNEDLRVIAAESVNSVRESSGVD